MVVTFLFVEAPPVLSLNQIDPIMNAARTLSESGSQEARLLPEGTVMVCCIGSLGKVGIAGRTVASNQQINSVIFDPRLIWSRYGFYACRLLKSRLSNIGTRNDSSYCQQVKV